MSVKPKKGFWDGSSQALRWHFAGFCGAAAGFALRLLSEYIDSTALAFASTLLALLSIATMFVAVFFLPKGIDSQSMRSDVRVWRDRWRNRRVNP